MTTSVVLIVLGSYLLLCLILFAIQEWFIFRPEKLHPDFQFRYDTPFEELNYRPSPEVHIHGIWFRLPAGQAARGLVFYLHGNTRSVKGWGKYAADFLKHGYEVVMVDYRGYGKSTGPRSEKGIRDDLLYVYEKIRQQYPEGRIYVYGRSLGSGFAAWVASQNLPAALILHAPYYNFGAVVSRYLFFVPISLVLRYPIRTDVWLRYVKCPIFILHGTRDRLIPMKAGRKLARLLPRQSRFIPVPRATHHNIPDFEIYHLSIARILENPQHALETL